MGEDATNSSDFAMDVSVDNKDDDKYYMDGGGLPEEMLRELLEKEKKVNETLQEEVTRLQQEKETVSESFSDAIAKYESENAELHSIIKSLKNEQTPRDAGVCSSDQAPRIPQDPVEEIHRSTSYGEQLVQSPTAEKERTNIKVAPVSEEQGDDGLLPIGTFPVGTFPVGTSSCNDDESVIIATTQEHHHLSMAVSSQTPMSGTSPLNVPDNNTSQDSSNSCSPYQNAVPSNNGYECIPTTSAVVLPPGTSPSSSSFHAAVRRPMHVASYVTGTGYSLHASLAESVPASIDSPRTSSASKQSGLPFWRSLIGIKTSVPDQKSNPDTKEKELVESWLSVLANWDTHLGSKRLYKMLQQGVPNSLRGAVWKKAIGDRLLITDALYSSTVSRVRVLRKYMMRTSFRYRSRLAETFGPDCSLMDDELGISDNETTNTEAAVKNLDNTGKYQPELPPANLKSATKNLESATKNESVDDKGSSAVSSPEVACPQDKQNNDHSCEFCTLSWTPAMISAFEIISADLHRTLPRLGVGPAFSRQDSTVRNTDNTGNHNYGAPRESQYCGSDTTESTKSPSSSIAPQHHPVVPNKEMNESSFMIRDNCKNAGGTDSTANASKSGDLLRSDSKPYNRHRHHRLSYSIPSEIGVRPLPVALFRNDPRKLYSRLRLLLETFVLLRPDIGYVQGMGFLAAVLLIYMEDDFDAFKCFCNLVTFDILLQEKVPAMAEALRDAQIPSSQFLVDWLYTLFTRCLPFDLVSRIWDLFLVLGDSILFQMSLGMLKHFQIEELNSPQSVLVERLSTFLSSSSTMHFEAIQADRFLEISASVAPQRDRLLKIIKNVQQSNNERAKQQQLQQQLQQQQQQQQTGPVNSFSASSSASFQQTSNQSSKQSGVTQQAPSPQPQPIAVINVSSSGEQPHHHEIAESSLSLLDQHRNPTTYSYASGLASGLTTPVAAGDHTGRRSGGGVRAIKQSARAFLGHRSRPHVDTTDVVESDHHHRVPNLTVPNAPNPVVPNITVPNLTTPTLKEDRATSYSVPSDGIPSVHPCHLSSSTSGLATPINAATIVTTGMTMSSCSECVSPGSTVHSTRNASTKRTGASTSTNVTSSSIAYQTWLSESSDSRCANKSKRSGHRRVQSLSHHKTSLYLPKSLRRFQSSPWTSPVLKKFPILESSEIMASEQPKTLNEKL